MEEGAGYHDAPLEAVKIYKGDDFKTPQRPRANTFEVSGLRYQKKQSVADNLKQIKKRIEIMQKLSALSSWQGNTLMSIFYTELKEEFTKIFSVSKCNGDKKITS